MPRRPLKRITRLSRKRLYSPGVEELNDAHTPSELQQEIVDPSMNYDRFHTPTNYEPREYIAKIKSSDRTDLPINYFPPALGDLNYAPSISRQLRGIALHRNKTKKGPITVNLDAKPKPVLKLFTDPVSLGDADIIRTSHGLSFLNKSLTRKALKEVKRRFLDVDKLEVVVEYSHDSPQYKKETDRFFKQGTAMGMERPRSQTKFTTRTIRLRRK